MSFSTDIKKELAAIETKKDCCRKAECYGIWLFSKCFSPLDTAFISESGDAVRKMTELAASVCGISARTSYSISRRSKTTYRVTVPDYEERIKLMAYFGHSPQELKLRINHANFEDSCCHSAFMRGVFLSCGLAQDPEKGYHIEFLTQLGALTKDLSSFISRIEGLQLKVLQSQRKGVEYLYLKDGSQCEVLLVYMGAGKAAMRMMQVKMYKEMKNDINRRTNFETANMDKSYSASARQIAAIAKISDAGRIKDLPEDQQEIAKMRLHNPELSLRELAQLMQLSPSSLNYRIKKIMEFSDKLQENMKI